MTVPTPSPQPNPIANLKALWFSPVTSKLLLPRKATPSRRSVGPVVALSALEAEYIALLKGIITLELATIIRM